MSAGSHYRADGAISGAAAVHASASAPWLMRRRRTWSCLAVLSSPAGEPHCWLGMQMQHHDGSGPQWTGRPGLCPRECESECETSWADAERWAATSGRHAASASGSATADDSRARSSFDCRYSGKSLWLLPWLAWLTGSQPKRGRLLRFLAGMICRVLLGHGDPCMSAAIYTHDDGCPKLPPAKEAIFPQYTPRAHPISSYRFQGHETALLSRLIMQSSGAPLSPRETTAFPAAIAPALPSPPCTT